MKQTQKQIVKLTREDKALELFKASAVGKDRIKLHSLNEKPRYFMDIIFDSPIVRITSADHPNAEGLLWSAQDVRYAVRRRNEGFILAYNI
jgi:hypothetical protein